MEISGIYWRRQTFFYTYIIYTSQNITIADSKYERKIYLKNQMFVVELEFSARIKAVLFVFLLHTMCVLDLRVVIFICNF